MKWEKRENKLIVAFLDMRPLKPYFLNWTVLPKVVLKDEPDIKDSSVLPSLVTHFIFYQICRRSNKPNS